MRPLQLNEQSSQGRVGGGDGSSRLMATGRRIGESLERMVYVIAGLPIAIHGPAIATTPAAREIRRAFARRYWRPASPGEAIELATGIILAPIAVPLAALWFTACNGPTIRGREGKSLAGQFVEQLRLYGRAGIVGPWYYILSLHRDGARRAPTFLQRCETKRGLYALLKTASQSPLGDKHAFAERCREAGVRCVVCELVIDSTGAKRTDLPDRDLFIKPLTGCGGKGAERWDRIAPKRWSDGDQVLGERELLQRLCSKGRPLIVQKRIRPHLVLQNLTSGALPTVRALTILDERGQPQLVAASFRMSIGGNRTVDNIHAGGLACAVSLDDGSLGSASDLGSDAHLGWHSNHPTTGARIEGTRLPYWNELKELALRAHAAFNDRVLIGWDIAIQEEGPIIIEGNRGPDMDLMQRFMDVGFCDRHRFTELLAHHLSARGYGFPERLSAPDEFPAKVAPGAAGTSAR
jgi:hypothetical protein